jgi:hypothetical protein
MDSDLEAFSHNPMDGSFVALVFQPTTLPTIQTNGSSRTKLDYCHSNKHISRVKLLLLILLILVLNNASCLGFVKYGFDIAQALAIQLRL